MSLKELFGSINIDGGAIAVIALLAMTVIQVTPIKLNPWSAILGWLGKQLNREVIEKVSSIEHRLDNHVKEAERAGLKAKRRAILSFGSSVIRGTNYHKEQFDYIIQECDSYERYCREHDVANGVATASISEIRRIYADRLRHNSFLQEQASSESFEEE